jgi:hypothetical protein
MKVEDDKLRSMLQRSNKNKQQNQTSEMFKKISNSFSKETEFVADVQKAFPGTTEADCRAMYRGAMYLREQIKLAEWQALNKLQDDIEEVREKMAVKEQW